MMPCLLAFISVGEVMLIELGYDKEYA